MSRTLVQRRKYQFSTRPTRTFPAVKTVVPAPPRLMWIHTRCNFPIPHGRHLSPLSGDDPEPRGQAQANNGEAVDRYLQATKLQEGDSDLRKPSMDAQEGVGVGLELRIIVLSNSFLHIFSRFFSSSRRYSAVFARGGGHGALSIDVVSSGFQPMPLCCRRVSVGPRREPDVMLRKGYWVSAWSRFLAEDRIPR